MVSSKKYRNKKKIKREKKNRDEEKITSHTNRRKKRTTTTTTVTTRHSREHALTGTHCERQGDNPRFPLLEGFTKISTDKDCMTTKRRKLGRTESRPSSSAASNVSTASHSKTLSVYSHSNRIGENSKLDETYQAYGLVISDPCDRS